ncbi:MAG: hypothetical protein NVV63_12395 [Opitutus sp.]|nr:hypothetical protein [Opitutus sp.]
MAVSANRLELLQIADAVAREKSIDRMVVIEAMQDAMEKAAKGRYGAETEIKVEINPRSGETRMWRLLEIVEEVEEPSRQIDLKQRAGQVGRSQGRRFPDRAAAADGIRPHRRAVRQAGHRAEGARCRARAHV